MSMMKLFCEYRLLLLAPHYFHRNVPLFMFHRLLNASLKWVRLNYATTHHDSPPPTTTQNMATTIHHQPKYIHHLPPPAKIYPPLSTISQKMDHQPAKAKIYWYIISFRHCFNSFFFFEMQYSFPWWRCYVIKFWPVCFSNSKFLLHS